MQVEPHPQTWQLLDPYRSICQVTSDRITMQTTPTLCFLSPTNHSYKIYTENLTIQNISPNFSSPIKAALSQGDRVFARLQHKVVNMQYYHIVKQWLLEDVGENVKTSMLKMGNALVIAEGEQVTVLDVEAEGNTQAKTVNVGWEIEGVVHPETYVNKVVVYGRQKMELWNVMTSRRVFVFQNIRRAGAEITAVEVSPVTDVVAVAFSDGCISMVNLKTAKVIFDLKQKSAAVSMSFSRNCRPLLATGNEKGALIIWQLNDKRILGKIADAHKSRIDTVIFIPGQLTILTNSINDNTIKQWKYDEIEQSHFRFLRQRCSLSNSIQNFNIQNNQQIVVQSKTNTLYTSLLSQNCNYLLPRCLSSRLPIHLTHSSSTIQIYKNQTLTKSIDIKQVPLHGCISLSLSHWFVCTLTRVLKLTNSQTLSYPLPDLPLGIICYQQHFIYVLTKSQIIVLDFQKLVLMGSYPVEDALFMVENHQGTFVAVATRKGVEVWDMKNCRKGRVYEFENSIQPLCLSFSADNKYLFVSFENSQLLIYSIINSQLYKTLRTQFPLIHHSTTPDGNFFLSCFPESREINLWYNLVGKVVSGVNEELIKFNTRIKVADTTNTRNYVNSIEIMSEPKEDPSFDLERYLETVGDADDGLTEFTELPLNRWMPLVHYDEIKQRNTIQVQIEKKYEAPFFLDFKNKTQIAKKQQQQHRKSISQGSRLLKASQDKLLSNTLNALELSQYPTQEQSQKIFQKLKAMSPAQVDLQLRNCLLLPGNSAPFLRMFISLLDNPSQFDVKAVYLTRFLKLLAEDILDPEIKDLLQQLEEVLIKKWKPIEGKLGICSAVATKMLNS